MSVHVLRMIASLVVVIAAPVAAQSVDEVRLPLPVTAVQAALAGRQDGSTTPVKLREPTLLVRSSGQATPSARPSAEAQTADLDPAALILLAAAIAAYVIGRRGLQR